MSSQELMEAFGVDEDAIYPIIDFLNRWDFVEIQRSAELLVRRKLGTISPAETFNLLTSIARGLAVSSTRPKLAERVACRVCNGQQLSFVGMNEVECNQCHEKQWYAIESS